MKFKKKKLTSDASARTFFRVFINQKNKILVSAKENKYLNLIAYAAVNKFLRDENFLAPKLFSHNYKNGIILIEDFGDVSFYKILKKKKHKLTDYKKLVNLLLDIQKIKPKQRVKNIKNSHHVIKKYSVSRLILESNIFFDWYLPLIYKKKNVKNIKIKANKILLKIYKQLYFSNNYFVHRDFHSQNLMKVGKKIGILDSQDALIGSPVYDLVSLIDDVRIKTKNDLKDKIFNYYIKNSIEDHRKNKSFFVNDFNILSVQRSLKIIGIFSRLYKRDKKKRYLKLIPYTWQLLELRMKSKIFNDLRDILDSTISKEKRKKILYK